MHIIEGQPLVGSPNIKVFTIITIIIIKAIKQNKIPIIAAIVKGTVENATNPSIAYLNKLKKDHFVSPAIRSLF